MHYLYISPLYQKDLIGPRYEVSSISKIFGRNSGFSFLLRCKNCNTTGAEMCGCNGSTNGNGIASCYQQLPQVKKILYSNSKQLFILRGKHFCTKCVLIHGYPILFNSYIVHRIYQSKN